MISGLSSLILIPLQLLHAAVKILNHKTLLLLCMVPYAVGITTFIGSVVLGFSYRDEIATYALGSPSGWLGQVLGFGFALINIFLSGILSLIVVIGFCGFFIEEFVDAILIEKGLKTGTPFSVGYLVSSTLRGLVDSLKRLLSLGIFAFIVFIASFFPPLYIPTLLLGAWLVGIDLFDMPLRLLNLPFGTRLKVINGHKLDSLIFGGYFSITLLIPFTGILLLPLFQWVACQRISGWSEVARIAHTKDGGIVGAKIV